MKRRKCLMSVVGGNATFAEVCGMSAFDHLCHRRPTFAVMHNVTMVP